MKDILSITDNAASQIKKIIFENGKKICDKFFLVAE